MSYSFCFTLYVKLFFLPPYFRIWLFYKKEEKCGKLLLNSKPLLFLSEKKKKEKEFVVTCDC